MNYNTYKIHLTGLMLALSVFLFTACNDNEPGMSTIQVSMIDAPADYDSVLIDLQDVQVNASGDAENGWVSLESAEMGIYDLLKLTNGEEAFLGEAELPAGQLSQVRLILGDGNSLVMDGETIPLTVPSGSQTGLKLNVNASTLSGVTYRLIIDFDAGQSVVPAGSSGKYNLKPVIRAEFEAQTGAISGVVAPSGTESIVYAIQGTDTVTSTYPDELTGAFLLRALDEGLYNVVANPSEASGFSTLTAEDVEVLIGDDVEIDSLKFE